ncbi:hypothetical protein RUM43_007901 [Polyplax serrata]|uniref:Conserved oligomeric Golgi complex subunit 6 n=1 Tax=Polyplax serrata TaxID=468196 RepID=A0AAN8Q6K4_POLSC
MNEKHIGGSIFSKRMSEVLDLRVENDKDILEGLAELSTFLPENTPENRANLKCIIEQSTMKINKDFLESFKNMKTSFGKVHKGINEMNSALADMKSNLASTKYKTNTLIQKTLEIQKEINNVTNKRDIVTAVIDKFQFNSNEISTLRNTEITSDMFAVLDKGEQIIMDCKLLLQTENSNLAQDILEQMLIYQDTGMNRLFKWVRGKCNTYESTVLSAILPQALAKLKTKSNLFEQILEELSVNRSIVLVRQFIDALTMGDRPIEHRVTEPRRYVGDMLAWLHQALPMEVEYLNFLLRNCDNSEECLQQTLRKITEGVCHPLRVRVEHVLLGEENSQDCILLQDIYVLLQDYNNIISQIISNSRLNTTIVELGEVAERTLLLALQNKVSATLGLEREPVPVNLHPQEATKQILALLVELLSANPSSHINENHVLQVVSCAVDPLMIQITETASKLPAVDMAIYLLNSFHLIETSLGLFPFLDERLERLKAQCDAQIDTLTSEQASALVGHLSLGPIYTVLQGNPVKPLSKLPAMEPSKLSSVSTKVEKFVASPNLYQLPQLTFLSSANHKLAVQKRSFTVISSIYGNMYQTVCDPENEYKNPSDILPLTPEAINNILHNIK